MSMIYVVHAHESGEGSTIVGASSDKKLAEKLANAADSTRPDMIEIESVPLLNEVPTLTATEQTVLHRVDSARTLDPEHLPLVPLLIVGGLLDLRPEGGFLALALTTAGRFALECAKPDELPAAPQVVPPFPSPSRTDDILG